MKLRNKKTGEIVERVDISIRKVGVVFNNDETYDSLAELNEEWEDYEEPKVHYSINQFGDLIDDVDGYMSETIDEMKKIGNYFNTPEEAEKAVEKLKAWKRLKDNGFKFDEWERDKEFSGDYIIKASDYHTCDDKDLELLFGGEE